MIRFSLTPSAHYFTYLCLTFIGGIAFSAWQPLHNSLIVVVLPTLLFVAFPARRKSSILFNCSILLFFLFLGIYHGSLSSRLPQSETDIYNRIELPADIVLVGYLRAMPLEGANSTTIEIASQYVRDQHTKHLISSDGTVLLRMRFPWPSKYQPGTLLAIRSAVKKPDMFRNLGSFNYPAYLARKNIRVTGYVRSPAHISPVTTELSLLHKIRYLPEQIRMQTGHFFDQNLTDPTHAALYRALLLGDRSHIPEPLYEQYKASGVAHILAISGMHLTLVGLFIYLFCYWLLRRSEYLILSYPVRKIAILLSLPPLLCYCFLAGLGSPSIRACIMALVVGFALCTDRVKSTQNLLSLAAVALLIASPQKLFTASFQLSFTAVASIALFSVPIKKLHNSYYPKEGTRFQKLYRASVTWISTGILVSSSAVAGTAPLILYHFNRFPVAGPLTNLIVEPLICFFALPLGLLSLLFMKLLPQLSVFLLQAGSSFITIANNATAWISTIPYTNLWLPQPPLLFIFCYYILLLFAPRLFLSGNAGRVTVFSLTALSLALLFIPGWRFATRAKPPPAVTFLDVGQGSATVIRTRDGKAILLDGGGSSFLTPSVGERIIAPFLWQEGITKLHGIIITHPDADHYNGLPFLIRHFSPGFVWTSTRSGIETGYRQLLSLCNRLKVPIHQAQHGEQIVYGETTVTCLVNSRRPPFNNQDSNSGLVLRVEMNSLSILFPGDIEQSVEQQIVDHHIPLQSDIILAAHHGSATSSSRRFMDAVNPSAIVVSAGRSRKNIYPSEGLLTFSQQNDVPLYVTHTDGAIWIQVENNRKKLYSYGDMQENPLLHLTQSNKAEQELY